MEMKLRKRNYNGFIHEAVSKKLSGDLTYINDFCLDIKGVGYTTCSVYRAAKPDKSKGHKEFVVLFFAGRQMYVTGRSRYELNKERKHSGIHCTACGTVMVSLNRHDYQTCGCPNEAMIDGGKDYQRFGAADMAKIQAVTVDLLTDKITVETDDAEESKE